MKDMPIMPIVAFAKKGGNTPFQIKCHKIGVLSFAKTSLQKVAAASKTTDQFREPFRCWRKV